jgi:hypothetical protein
VTPAQIEVGAVITQLGCDLIVTTVEEVQTHPLEPVTVTEMVADPAAPAVQMISRVLLPAVIVPLLAVQA